VKGRIIDIIVYLMGQIDEKGRGLSHFDSLTEDLKARGYADEEINTAFFWLLERLRLRLSQLARSAKYLPKRSSRILHITESMLFSQRGYGYLIQLYQLGLIDDEQREQIIQRALMSGLEQIGESEVKLLAARLLLSTEEQQVDPACLLLLDEEVEGTVH
jgi:uncharacterized protein Smg (DUF494 family)